MGKKKIYIIAIILITAIAFAGWVKADERKKEYHDAMENTVKYFDVFAEEAKAVIKGSERVNFEDLSKSYMVFANHISDWNYMMRDKAEAGGDQMLLLEFTDLRDVAQEFYFELVHMYYIGDLEKDGNAMKKKITELERVLKEMTEKEAA